MSNKREYSLKIGRKKKIQQLITEFNQQIKISSTQQNFSPEKTFNDRLPIIPQERPRPNSDRFLSQRLKYQRNLHTVIFQIKGKLQATQKLNRKESGSQSYPTSPLKLSNDICIKAINLKPEKTKTNLSKSYVEAAQKKLAEERRKKRPRYERFDFEPWGSMVDNEVLQTIQL